MPSLGLGLSLGSSNPKPGFDPDAWGYISANNILNSAIIDDFDSNANSAGFVGTGRLQVTTTNFNITSTDDFSWGGWVFFTNASNNHFPFGFGNSNKFYWLSSTIYWEWGSINVGLSSYGAKTLNTWYHIFMTTSRSGGSQTHKIYVNGSVVNTQTSSVTHSMSNPTFYVGGTTSSEYLEGRVDGVCIFKRTLSDADVTWLYNSGKGRRYTDAVADSKTSNLLAWYELDETSGSRADASGNGNTLTINGTGVGFNQGIIPFRTIAVNPQTQINNFVKQIKNLGLWNSMVCWLFRSFQNFGTGNTAFSLGGLGTFNGTLVNGPVRTSNGVHFDGSNDRITLPNNSFGTGNSATSIWAFLQNDTITTRQVVLSQGDNNSSTDAFDLESPGASGGVDNASMAFTASPSVPASNLWKSLFVGNTSAGFFGKDGGSLSQFTLSNTLNKSGSSCCIGSFGAPLGANPFDGTISAVIKIDATPTSSLNSSIYTLYKNTLGQGLGLP